MTQVNVDSMIKNFDKKEFVTKTNEKQMLKAQVQPDKKITIKMGKPTSFQSKSRLDSILNSIECEPRNHEVTIPLPRSETLALKNTALDVASLSMRDPNKRIQFRKKLADNEFLNTYVDRKIGNSFLARLTDDFKAFAIFGCNYLEVYNNSEFKALPTPQALPAPDKLSKVFNGTASDAEINQIFTNDKDRLMAKELNKIINNK
jgi:hypothetical protein